MLFVIAKENIKIPTKYTKKHANYFKYTFKQATDNMYVLKKKNVQV